MTPQNSEVLSKKIAALLTDLCGTEIKPSDELIDSGLMDSYAFIELLEELRDMGYDVQPTQLPRESFTSAESLARALIEN